MKRKHKLYSRPKKPYDKKRIDEEFKIKEEFGLKNKKEIWKAEAKIKLIRERAKRMIYSNQEEQEKFFGRLKAIGLKANSISEVFTLDKKDYLNRRLQTILVKNKLAKTPKSARQLIVHKKVLIGGKAINSPSYIVPIDLEKKITLKISKNKTPLKKQKNG
jgi:small subunit ribosomal protein S4